MYSSMCCLILHADQHIMIYRFHVHTGEHVDASVMLVLVVCIVSVHVLDAGCIVSVRV